MLSTALWVTALGLESAFLWALQRKFLKHCHFLYLFLACVLLSDLSLIPFHYLWPKIYACAYRGSQYFSLIVGCGVVWHAYNVALERHPSTARMARNVHGFFLNLAITRILVKAWSSSNWILGKTILETERDLRIVQLGFLVGLVILFACYAIPLGSNGKGMIYGCGLFVATSVVHPTSRDRLGDSFERPWGMFFRRVIRRA